jgi:hypothetical protein
VSCLLYIDDRLIEEFNGYLPPQIDNSTTRAKIAIHLAVKLFVTGSKTDLAIFKKYPRRLV